VPQQSPKSFRALAPAVSKCRVALVSLLKAGKAQNQELQRTKTRTLGFIVSPIPKSRPGPPAGYGLPGVRP
jgi:hypothetical protein